VRKSLCNGLLVILCFCANRRNITFRFCTAQILITLHSAAVHTVLFPPVVGAVSSSNCWPSCIPSGDQDSTSQPHFPSNLVLVHIIPDLGKIMWSPGPMIRFYGIIIVLWKDVFAQLIDLCTRHKIVLPRCDRLVQYARQRIHELQQETHDNNSKQQQQQQSNGGSLQHHDSESNSDNLLIHLLSTSSQDDTEVLYNHHHDNDTGCDCGNCYECNGDHSVSSTNEDTFLPRGVYSGDMHIATLCDNRLLWLKDPLHEGNMAAFQEHWRRGEVCCVLVLWMATVSTIIDIFKFRAAAEACIG